MEVESEPDGVDTECSEFVDVFGTGDIESFDGVVSGKKGSTDFDFDRWEEDNCAGPTGGGLDGSEGWSRGDNLEGPS